MYELTYFLIYLLTVTLSQEFQESLSSPTPFDSPGQTCKCDIIFNYLSYLSINYSSAKKGRFLLIIGKGGSQIIKMEIPAT